MPLSRSTAQWPRTSLCMIISLCFLSPLCSSLALDSVLQDMEPLASLSLTNLNFSSPFTAAGIKCADDKDPAHRELVLTEACTLAIGSTLSESPQNFLRPKIWGTATYHGTGAESADITVPKVWEPKGAPSTKCYMVINSAKKGSAGRVGADAAEFSLAGAVYFASLVLQQCLVRSKNSYGGRFIIKDNGFYVDITGTLPAPPKANGEIPDDMFNITQTFSA